jgi:hypothetical protein
MSISRFEIGGRDLKGDAVKLLARLQSQDDGANLLASVLDRWRRASYLAEIAEKEEEEGGDSPITAEEVFLHYFHVIELLGDDALKKTESAVKARVRNFLSEFYSDEAMLVSRALTQKAADRFSVIYPVLSEDMSVTTKVLRLLSEADAAAPRVRAFVGELVKVRNAIAHGRAVFRPKVMWPLPAFFPLHESAGRLLPLLRVFAARLIAKYCDASTWSPQWEEVKRALPATPEEIRRHVAAGDLDKLAPCALITGNPLGVSVAGLVDQYFEGQIDFGLIEQIVGKCLLHVRLSDEIADQMLDASAILADSRNGQLSKRARHIVKKVIAMQWEPYSNPKDLFRYAEYKGRPLTWYRAWLTSRRASHARRCHEAGRDRGSQP